MEEGYKESKPPLSTAALVGSLGTLAAVIGVLFQARQELPYLIWIGLTSILVVAMLLVVIYGLLGEKILEWMRASRMRSENDRFAREAFPEFTMFVRRLQPFLSDPGRDDYSVKRIWDAIRSHPKYVALQEFPVPNDVKGSYDNLLKRISSFNGSYEEFERLNSEFNEVLELYNDICIEKPLQILSRLGKEEIKEEHKAMYRAFRENYSDYIRGLQVFADELNQKHGKYLIRVPRNIRSELV